MVCFTPNAVVQPKYLGWKSKKSKLFVGSYFKFERDFGKFLANIASERVPCGQCLGCRVLRSKSWALRCMHEASLYGDDNCFITLTYRDEDLPHKGILKHKDFQNFMKRFRKFLGERRIRYYMVGEYGEKNDRPHFHACIFNYKFPDLVLDHVNDNGDFVYRSDILAKIWGKGFVTVGNLTFKSAAYVARYVMKKVNGELSEAHYERFDTRTGEVFSLKPEYNAMSKGIGKGWFDQFYSDVYPSDMCVDSKGHKHRPPRYYDNLFQGLFPDEFDQIKAMRIVKAKKHANNNTEERLQVRHEVLKQKMKVYKRKI